MTTLNINDRDVAIDAAADVPLLWVLRDALGLKGTKYGCGKALCGACTVLVDGAPLRACVTPVATLAGKRITTIEGLGSPVARAVQQTWIELDVAQCGDRKSVV